MDLEVSFVALLLSSPFVFWSWKNHATSTSKLPPAGLTLSAFFGLSIASVVVADAMANPTELSVPLLITVVVAALVFCYVLIVFIQRCGQSGQTLHERDHIDRPTLTKTMLVALFVSAFARLVESGPTLFFFGIRSPHDLALVEPDRLAVLVLLAPLIEEVFFRYYLWQILRVGSRMGLATTATVTLVVFVLVHSPFSGAGIVIDLRTTLVLATLGVVYTAVRIQTNRLAASVGIHGFCNLWAVIPG